jgi:beta-glucosidase-like glycosyl hydrolase
MFFSYPGTPYIAKTNSKGWSLDHTCIHGLNKASGVTVFPHAIAQGASWDRDLVTRVSNATAVEARILSAKGYESSKGANMGEALSCDGGPLANSAHDPRWGRISETYAEDPYLIQVIGVVAMRGLQNPQPVAGGKPEDVFFATRQVTRHYIGYHGASPDISGHTTYIASNRSLADSYFPTYGSFQRPTAGFADGIMCAMSLLNGVPSCSNHLLLTTMLRDTWKSDAIVQSDCCDSVGTMVNEISPHTGKPVVNKTEALGLAVNEGLGAVSSSNPLLQLLVVSRSILKDCLRK